jgi:hypothetical protein
LACCEAYIWEFPVACNKFFTNYHLSISESWQQLLRNVRENSVLRFRFPNRTTNQDLVNKVRMAVMLIGNQKCQHESVTWTFASWVTSSAFHEKQENPKCVRTAAKLLKLQACKHNSAFLAAVWSSYFLSGIFRL